MAIPGRFRLPLSLAAMSVLTFLATVFIFSYIRKANSPQKQVSEFNIKLNDRYLIVQNLVRDLADQERNWDKELSQNNRLFHDTGSQNHVQSQRDTQSPGNVQSQGNELSKANAKSQATGPSQDTRRSQETEQSQVNRELQGNKQIQEYEHFNALALKLPQGISLFVLKNDLLVFWSDNSISFDPERSYPRIVRTDNGFFQQNKFETGDLTFILLDLIRHQYPYENEYLKSDYNPVYNLNSEYEIDLAKGDYRITDKSGNTLFYINPSGKQILTGEQEFVLYILTFLSFILVAFSIYYFSRNSGLSVNKSFLILTLFIIITRYVQFVAGIPKFFSEFDLFSPLNYASSPWLPSLGDFLTNVFLLAILSFLLYRDFKNREIPQLKRVLKSIVTILCLLAVNFLYYFSLHLLDTLILNSAFELDLSRILDFSVYSLLGYLIIALILLSLFYISYILVRISVKLIGNVRFAILFAFVSTGIWLILHSLGLYTPQWQELVLFLLFGGLLIIVISRIIPYPHITASTLLILILTFISTFCLYHNTITKEQEERKLMALRLSSEQDKIAEFLYTDLEKTILADTMLFNYFMSGWFDPSFEDYCIDYLKSKYLTGFWSKYNAQVTLCYPEKELMLKPSGIVVSCNEYFNSIISNITNKTSNKTFFYIRESYGVNNYIARIPVYNSRFRQDSASIVIEFTQKYVPKGLGYPELLLDQSFISFYDLSVYSYAIYSRGELIKNVGEYAYSISEKPFLSFKTDYHFFNKNGYNHLYHIVNDNTSIIISKKNPSVLDKFAPFTYQLIFHILLIFILTTTYSLRLTIQRYPDLKTQLQIMLVALILFASIITGSTTLHNIRSLNEKKNKDMLSEKAHSVLIEIEHKLDTVSRIENAQKPYLQELLTKFSLVFFSDINLYTTQGSLLATSRPEIFNEGLRSGFMSTEAYNQIAINQRTFFVTNEQIGSYKYLSAYIPFRNKENELIAYINLPFFAREHELRQEISSFLVTFVNVYIILTAIAVFISLLVGNYVTRPLQLIRDQFSHVKLDRRNEKISYNRHDELGNLINEYNLMLDKLAESVDKLAQSERESAWKEMARQIAHEIKNPLTPMKLSIQHLYRSWQDKAPDWEARLEKTTTSIIQQIDSLAAIASAFSDFAKFPMPSNERLEIKQAIKDTLALFASQTNYSISFILPDAPCFVYADKKQLSRVLVNLVNNAIQSIPADRKGQIDIRLQSEGGEHIISVTDNGTGIPEEQKPRIFSPNFTTKSGGAGLGLAMVKNIIDSFNGKITFKSQPGGTTFEIRLPSRNDANTGN
ncbi:MAG TPA: ATP-binding protein [Lentimicrobium sp.]|nr:ATP-binding protein [Lentimicrobium sp.]